MLQMSVNLGEIVGSTTEMNENIVPEMKHFTDIANMKKQETSRTP